MINVYEVGWNPKNKFLVFVNNNFVKIQKKVIFIQLPSKNQYALERNTRKFKQYLRTFIEKHIILYQGKIIQIVKYK